MPSNSSEDWSFEDLDLETLVSMLENEVTKKDRPVHVVNGYYCTNYFPAKEYPNLNKGKFLSECLGEIRKLSLIALEPAESMEELRGAVRKTKEKNPDARLVNAPEEHKIAIDPWEKFEEVEYSL